MNIVGGIWVDDFVIDLSICVVFMLSYEDVSVFIDVCFAGEVGLLGEIRVVNCIE